MNKKLAMLSLIYLSLSINSAFADLAPPEGQKRITICTKLMNVSTDDHLLLGSLVSNLNPIKQYLATPLVKDECLPSGYQSGFHIYLVTKKQWALIAKSPYEVKTEGTGISTTQTIEIATSNTLSGRTLNYALETSADGKFKLKLKTIVDSFNDGSKDKVTTSP